MFTKAPCYNLYLRQCLGRGKKSWSSECGCRVVAIGYSRIAPWKVGKASRSQGTFCFPKSSKDMNLKSTMTLLSDLTLLFLIIATLLLSRFYPYSVYDSALCSVFASWLFSSLFFLYLIILHFYVYYYYYAFYSH